MHMRGDDIPVIWRVAQDLIEVAPWEWLDTTDIVAGGDGWRPAASHDRP